MGASKAGSENVVQFLAKLNYMYLRSTRYDTLLFNRLQFRKRGDERLFFTENIMNRF